MGELSKILIGDKPTLNRLSKITSKIMREEPKSLTRKEMSLLRSVLYCYSSKANVLIGSGNVQDIFRYYLDNAITNQCSL